jgi:tetratricopeptide (TPR) repeat protein
MPVDSFIDKRRVLQAIRRGWVRQDQVEECLLDLDDADSIVEGLARRGLLSPDQVQQLCDDAGARITEPELGGVLPSNPPNQDPKAPSPGSGNLQAGNLEDVLAQGDVIADRYLVEKTCAGGFGQVYLCTDMVSGQRAALKTLLREHLGSGRLVEMFRKEILLWIQLGDHPNIVLAYGMEEFMRLPFVVMECVDGGSLEDVLERGSLSWQAAANYGWQIANGLEHAGRVCGLIHRDLKPANVLLTREGTAKVTDFGISLARGMQGETLAGTPPYMAPEQWQRPKDVDVRSDVYAFGVTLFELACGQRPFPDHLQDSVYGYRTDHLTKTPPDPRQFNPEIPEGMAQLILQCLEKRQDRRPQDFAAVRKVLEPLAGPRPAGYSAGPHVVAGLVNQSRTYNLLRQFADAERTAREAVSLAPDDANARVALGNAFGEQGNYREALRQLERAHRLDSRNPMAIVNSARYAALALDPVLAQTWLDRGIEKLEPRHLEGISNLLIELGRVPEAIRLCRAIVEDNPLAIIAWNNLAIALRRTGDLKGALECATRSVEINPRYAKGWSNRATVLVQLQRFDEAIRAADRSLQFDPATAGAYAAKAAALGASGRMEEGRKCVLKGLAVMPGNPLLTRALGQF